MVSSARQLWYGDDSLLLGMTSLRLLAPDDAPAVFKAVDASRPALRRWMVWYQDSYSLAHAEAWIQHVAATAAAGTGFHFAILDAREDLVGVIGLEDVRSDSGRAMLGYWIATHATGRGLGRRAVEQVVAWVRARGDVTTIWALVAEANLASRRILELNDFRVASTGGPDERGDVVLTYELRLPARPALNC
jgi:RimJ/RimL family protein N-acetyltransferase